MIYSLCTPGHALYLGKSGYFANDINDFNNLSKCVHGILSKIDYDTATFNCKFKFFMPCPT